MWKLAFVSLGVAFATAAGASPRYSVTVLETPAGVHMDGFGLNNNGDVVGGVQGENSYEAYIRRADGTYEALGGFGGNRSSATAIANNGIIAGQARTGTTGATSVPFIRIGDGPLTPIALPADARSALTSSVNESGTVTGNYSVPGQAVAFRWSEARGLETITTVDGLNPVQVLGLNGIGQAVGSSFGRAAIAFRWNVDGSTTLLERVAAPEDFLYSGSIAHDINDAGQIAGTLGWEMTPGNYAWRLAIWDSAGAIARTAELAGWDYYGATLINGLGDVASSASRTIIDPSGFYNEETALLWRLGENPVDLNSLVDHPSIRLNGVFGINDRGQILATGVRDGLRVDVLLTELAAIPEPSTWLLLISGFGLVGFSARRRGALRMIPI